jgi:hypothetical protein
VSTFTQELIDIEPDEMFEAEEETKQTEKVDK